MTPQRHTIALPAGWRRLGPGAVVDAAGDLHISAPEMLDALGLADTAGNRDWVVGWAAAYFARAGNVADVEVVVVD